MGLVESGVQKMYDAKFFGIENLSLKTGENNAVFISCSTPTCTCQLKRLKQKEFLLKNSGGAKNGRHAKRQNYARLCCLYCRLCGTENENRGMTSSRAS